MPHPSNCSRPGWMGLLSNLVQGKVSLPMAGDLELSDLSDNSKFQPKPLSEIPAEELHMKDHEQARKLACGMLDITQKQYQANKASMEGPI